jgi:hypothetical protein
MPKQIEVESGKYEGTIEFRGEGGFATARASRAAADAHVLLGLVCGESGSEGSGGHSPGARLTIHHDGPAERTEFVVRKNSPTRVARFAASIEERRGRIGIERQISSTAAPATFRFAFPAKTAVVRPGAPFHGAALYNGDRGKFNRVGGGLTADFPGHSGVHLVGPHTSASMVRYVDNPSHPFDLPGADVFSLPRLGAWLSTKP